MTRLRAARLGLALLLALAPIHEAPAEGPPARPGPLRIRTSQPFARCVAAVLEGPVRARGLTAVVETGDPRSTAGADLVIGDDDEMTRVLEGGLAEVRTAVDLGYVPSRRRRLVAVAAAVSESAHVDSARLLLVALAQPEARRAFASCARGGVIAPAPEPRASGQAAGPASYALAVADWWLPACSLAGNAYNDPQEVLGGPDAVNLGGKDNYRGLMSLGQGGYVTVDMGGSFANGPGPDVRVYQTTTGEPVSVYAAAEAVGPFTALALRRYCGERTPGVFSNHCDFDLAEGGLASARYLRIEDGEIYPCRAAGTVSEGPDIDAVELLR